LLRSELDEGKALVGRRHLVKQFSRPN
jgi:hypothetical protein